jgi:hypothetical protein
MEEENNVRIITFPCYLYRFTKQFSSSFTLSQELLFKFLCNWCSGGWSPAGSTRHYGRQLCQPRVIMTMEKWVE